MTNDSHHLSEQSNFEHWLVKATNPRPDSQAKVTAPCSDLAEQTSQSKTTRHETDAAAPLFGRSRRLAIEVDGKPADALGNQIDYSIWNLDSIQNNYAVISQGGTLPAETAGAANDSVSAGSQLNVSWVQVPGLTLSPNDAAALAYRHYREAVSQGVVNYQVSSALYEQWKSGFAYDPNATRVPVYALGFSQTGGNLGGLLNDSFGGFDSDSSVDDVFTTPVVPPLGPTISFDLGGLTVLDSSGQPFSPSPTRPSDGFVSVVTFDTLGSHGDRLTSIPWRDSINLTNDFADGPFTREFLNLSTNFQNTLDVSLDTALASPVVETVASDNSLDQVGMEERGEASVVEGRIGLTTGASTIISAIDATLLVVNSKVGTVGVDDVVPQSAGAIITTVVDALAATPRNQSAPQTDLDAVIDQLVSGGVILVRSGDETAVENSSLGDQTEIVSTSGESSTHQADFSEGEVAAEPEVELLAEGGMVPVEVLVATVSNGSLEISYGQDQLAGAGEASDVVGELARVAVMELIEGATEPMAPVVDGDHVALVAVRDGMVSERAFALARSEFAAADRSLVRAFAQQAGAAIALAMPVNPDYVVALVSSISDVLTGVVVGEEGASDESSGDEARREAFAQFEDSDLDSEPAPSESSLDWLDAAPLVALLACERVVAANRKRQQRDPERQPAKRPA